MNYHKRFIPFVLLFYLLVFVSPCPAPTWVNPHGGISTTTATLGNVVNADSYDSFAACIDTIGTTQATVVISSIKAVAQDVTVPTTCTLWFYEGGMLNISSGKVVSVDNMIVSGLFRIKEGDGTMTFGYGIPEVYPQWFGAVPDSVTDSSAAIHEALDTGKRVVCTGGVFMVSNVDIDEDGASLVIDNSATIRKLSSSTTTTMLDVRGSRISIFGPGTIDGNSSSFIDPEGKTHGINFNCVAASWSDLYIGGGLKIKNMLSATYDGTAHLSYGSGIYIGGDDTGTYFPTRVTIDGCFFDNCGREGIRLTCCQYVNISNNHFNNCWQGIDTETDETTQIIEDVNITGNTFYLNAKGGIHAWGRGFNIADNCFESSTGGTTSQHGILVNKGGDNSYSCNHRIIGNLFRNFDNVGVYVQANGRGHHVIEGNTFIKNTLSDYCIRDSTGGSIIVNNKFLGSSTTEAFVRVDPAASGCDFIQGNYFMRGSETIAVDLQSSGYNKVGRNYYDENKGAFTSRVSGRLGTDIVENLSETINKGANFAISSTKDWGVTYTNSNASATITATLPACLVGLEYTFIRLASQLFYVHPSNSTELIRYAVTADKYLDLGATNGCLTTLKCMMDGTTPLASGYYGEAATNAVLTDSMAAWGVNQYITNFTVWNVTDGSKATITANTATTVTGVLSGGTNNFWSPGSTGTHNSSTVKWTLTDSTKTWTEDQWIGHYVYNTTDGSWGICYDNDATTCSVVLAGGTNNYWTNADAYIISGDLYKITGKYGYGIWESIQKEGIPQRES